MYIKICTYVCIAYISSHSKGPEQEQLRSPFVPYVRNTAERSIRNFDSQPYIYIYTSILAYIHTYIKTYRQTHRHRHTDTHTQTHTHTSTQTLQTCDCFKSEHELHMAISRIGVLLDTLEEMGLVLSLEKSHVIIAISGTNCRDVVRRTIHHDAKGPYILIPRAQGRTSKLRVSQQVKYLGIQISYRLFEKQTVKHRIAAAQLTFSRLRRWLCNRNISLKQRLNIWRACVFSTLMYGIFPTGFTYNDVLQLQQCIFSMYRNMIGDQQFYHTAYPHPNPASLWPWSPAPIVAQCWRPTAAPARSTTQWPL